jgi:hypothetical protein
MKTIPDFVEFVISLLNRFIKNVNIALIDIIKKLIGER